MLQVYNTVITIFQGYIWFIVIIKYWLYSLCCTSLFFIPVSLFLFHRCVHLCYILDCLCKWYHMVFVFLFLGSLSMIISRCIYIAANSIISFFSWQTSSPLCVCMWVCIYIHTHHIFIHSSVSGHLECFHVLAIVNNASLNIGVHVSFWIKVLFECPGLGLLDHVVTQFLDFWGPFILFSIVVVPV